MYPVRYTKQKHKRFDPTDIVRVTHEEAMGQLVGGHLAASSVDTYDSRLRTLTRFLKSYRGTDVVHPVDCSQEEFIQFLANWKRQGMGPAKGVHAALILEMRKLGIDDTFLALRSVRLAVKGASAQHVPTEKGIVDPVMMSQWEAATLQLPKESIGWGTCTTCGDTSLYPCMSKTRLKQLVVLAGRLSKECALRSANLKDLRRSDDHGTVIHVAKPKRPQQKYLIFSQEARDVFYTALSLSHNEFLFPRCIAHHLDLALRWAEYLYEWTPGLVFSPHCIRHSHMEQKCEQIEMKVKELVFGISGGCINGYTRSAHERKKRVRQQN